MRFLFLVLITFYSLHCFGNTPIETPAQAEFNSALGSVNQPAMNVYFLSGLGADERAFSKLKLDEHFHVHYIQWIAPLKKETLTHYASRLVMQIDTTQPFQLVGLSFGGIMASVLSDLIRPRQIIIVSSMSTFVPLSKFYQNLIKITLWHPLAAPVLKSANSFTYKLFGAKTKEEKKLLKQILASTDSKFLKWALIRMTGWDRPKKAVNLYHIHGTADKLITSQLVQPDAWIQDGGHLMIYSQSTDVSILLNRQLSSVF